MQYIKPDVTTVCIGQAASMGALLLAAGAEKKRYALPHARIMIHQPMGGFQGQASDIAIQAKEILRMKDALNAFWCVTPAKAWKMSQKDTDRDNFMSGVEAKDYGIVDHVITNRDDLDHLRPTRRHKMAKKMSPMTICSAPSAGKTRKRSKS
jgi:ATP-dependent Clp protease protease subunit